MDRLQRPSNTDQLWCFSRTGKTDFTADELLVVSEHELLESLPASRQCVGAEEQLLRLLYESKLKKYQAPSESLLPPAPALTQNLDLAVAQAERHYYNCNYQQCSHITDE
jgi:anaphase-promoting complex subunit 6